MQDSTGNVVDVGPRVPRVHNRFLYWLGRSILRAWGWRIHMRLPDEPRLIVIAAPHTSNWDFVFGIAAILASGLRFNWYAKHTLFTGPWGGFFRAIGGVPVDRSAPGGVVVQTADLFARSEQLMIALAPEGTRSRVTRWKRGFHHIALAARIPVAVGYIDYDRKQVGIEFLFRPTGDWEADMQPVFEFYRHIRAKRPQDFSVET